ncbi:MAG: hypothetical protein ACOCXH_04000 [Cyclobacteriaceae bacterium]
MKHQEELPSYQTIHENAGSLYRIQLNRYKNGKFLQQNAIFNTALAQKSLLEQSGGGFTLRMILKIFTS